MRACRDDHSLALGPEHPRRAAHQRTCRRGHRHRRHRPRRGPRRRRLSAGGTDGNHRGRTSPSPLRTYLDHLAVERGLAANTLTSYRRDLRRYLGFLDEPASTTSTRSTEATVSAFLMRLREGDADHPPLSATSAGRTVVAVRGFHKFCVTDGLATAGPGGRRTSARARPAGCRRHCRSRDVEAILEAAGSAGTTLALRDRALLEVLYGTGARISEAVGLDVDDVDRVEATVAAARQGREGPDRPDRLLRARGRRRLSHPRPARAGRRRHRRAGRRALPERARVAGSRASRPGPCWSRPPTGQG